MKKGDRVKESFTGRRAEVLEVYEEDHVMEVKWLDDSSTGEVEMIDFEEDK